MLILQIELLPWTLAVCRLPPNSDVPAWAWSAGFCSVTRTADELSIVCMEANVPSGITIEPGWRCLRVVGPLPFQLTGILESLVSPLAQAGISVFAMSTFDTDYLLIKQVHVDATVAVLTGAGHHIQIDRPNS